MWLISRWNSPATPSAHTWSTLMVARSLFVGQYSGCEGLHGCKGSPVYELHDQVKAVNGMAMSTQESPFAAAASALSAKSVGKSALNDVNWVSG